MIIYIIGEQMNKNPEALALGYKNAVWKSMRLKELGITEDMTEEAKDELIEKLCKKKEAEGQGDWKQFVKGQRWYVDSLVAFAAMDAQERLEHAYMEAFPETASEEEMVNALNALI